MPTNETVAFICAMPMELVPLTKQLGLRKEVIDGVAVRTGMLGERRVVAVVTGMGTELAASGTRRLLDAITPDRVVVVGITGAVDEETPIGALILPERVVHSETGSEHRPTALGEGTAHGTLWTTNVMTPPAELPGLRAKGVVALDMETAAVADECEQRGIPWSVFRAVSDRATDASLDDEVFRLANQDGTPNPRAIVRYLVKHPGAVPGLMRLAKGGNLARHRAASAAIAAVTSAPMS
jgi:adenosylhomocysteine nucleosidase